MRGENLDLAWVGQIPGFVGVGRKKGEDGRHEGRLRLEETSKARQGVLNSLENTQLEGR